MEESLKHSELTEVIIGAYYEVYNELGFGFLESVYEEAMMLVLQDKGLSVEQQVLIPVWFRGKPIGRFEADLLVEKSVIIELKAVSRIADVHVAQLMHYLRATEIEVGLVMNFGQMPDFKRRVFENSRKSHNKKEPIALEAASF